MAFLSKASPALVETLLNLYRAAKPRAIDQRLYEFGAVEYHVQSSLTDEDNGIYLSISTPVLSQDVTLIRGLPHDIIKIMEGIPSDVIGIVEPPKEGYQLTLRLDFNKLPRRKDSLKIIREISTMGALMLSRGLKHMLRNINTHGTLKPIKLAYRPKEPFFIVRQPQKITAVFPMRFKEETDLIVATALFQELMDFSSLEKWSKVPLCTWSPIPPPELRGEALEDLSTNGGFFSFDFSSRHLKGKRLDKTVWNLLNFHALVKYYVKATRGFIQRRMRKRLDNLVKMLHQTRHEEDEEDLAGDLPGCGCMRDLVNISRRRSSLKQGRGGKSLKMKINRMACHVKIHGFRRFRRRWPRLPQLPAAFNYKRLNYCSDYL